MKHRSIIILTIALVIVFFLVMNTNAGFQKTKQCQILGGDIKSFSGSVLMQCNQFEEGCYVKEKSKGNSYFGGCFVIDDGVCDKPHNEHLFDSPKSKDCEMYKYSVVGDHCMQVSCEDADDPNCVSECNPKDYVKTYAACNSNGQCIEKICEPGKQCTDECTDDKECVFQYYKECEDGICIYKQCQNDGCVGKNAKKY